MKETTDITEAMDCSYLTKMKDKVTSTLSLQRRLLVKI